MKIDFSQAITESTRKAEQISALKALVAETRYNKEIQGIVVNGISIDTERGSQAMITGAALSALLDNTYICRWKTPTGFVELDSTSLIQVSQSMRNYVQACFDREAELVEAITNNTYVDSMLTEGWPDAGISNNT